MSFKKIKGNEISGHLEIKIIENKDEFDSQTEMWSEVLIHGDPKGLRTLANQLIYLADLNQELVDEQLLPTGAREHIQLNPNIDLSRSSVPTLIGRLDAKGDKKFYFDYVPKDEIKE